MNPDGPTRVTPEEALSVFERRSDTHAPLTAPEVAEALDCARRTAYGKLEALTERGDLRTKKVGARGRVWWLSGERLEEARSSSVDDTGPEQGLRELHDASRRLIRAETRADVCEVAVDAARRVLGLPLNGLWLYDEGTDSLEPMAWTDQGVEEFGDPPSFPIDGSLVGRTFREGTHHVYDDVTAEGEPYDPETRVRSELVLPLGGYGVMNAASLEVGAFDEIDVTLGRVLAATVETALERADRLEERRERRRELERQRDELETLNQLNALVEEIIRSLVGAATREEIERTLCEALSTSEFYVDAHIVERGSEPGSVVLRAGVDEDGTGAPVRGIASEPVVTALEEGTPEIVRQLGGDERPTESPRTEAPADGIRSCLVAPLSYADTVFGALVVHAPSPDAFSDREVTAFETLGRVVGFVINATNNRRLLLGNTAVEVEFTIDGTDAWFPALADQLGCTVVVSGVVPTEDGALLEYATVEGATAEEVGTALAEMPAIETARVLADDGERCSIECAVRGAETGFSAVAEYGASVRTARGDGGIGRITARFPSAVSAREAVSVVETGFESADLVAKRVVDLSDRSVPTVRQHVDERLTDRQLSALRAAFLAGYYDYPRGTTAEDLAASLDIAPSTLHQHLQAAQRKLLATVFDESE